MLITKEHPIISTLLTSLDRIEERINGLAAKTIGSDLMPPKEVMRVYHLTKDLLYSYRKSGELPYIKVGRKIFYSRQDIEEFLRRNTYDDYANR